MDKPYEDGIVIAVMSFDQHYQQVVTENNQAVWYDRGRKVRSFGNVAEFLISGVEKTRVTLTTEGLAMQAAEKMKVKTSD